MTVDSLQAPDTAQAEPLKPSAGALLRSHRESLGLKPEALATKLHVPVSKLNALENDQLDALPDAMFARALALAVCRQLNVDPAPVLARLPEQDVSRLATHNERGLDFPLKRPSLLPATGLKVLLEMPRWQQIGAVAALVAALVLANQWGETDLQTLPAAASTTTTPLATQGVSEVVTPLANPTSDAATVAAEMPSPVKGTSTVVTPLQPNAVLLTPVAPAASSEGNSK